MDWERVDCAPVSGVQSLGVMLRDDVGWLQGITLPVCAMCMRLGGTQLSGSLRLPCGQMSRGSLSARRRGAWRECGRPPASRWTLESVIVALSGFHVLGSGRDHHNDHGGRDGSREAPHGAHGLAKRVHPQRSSCVGTISNARSHFEFARSRTASQSGS